MAAFSIDHKPKGWHRRFSHAIEADSLDDANIQALRDCPVDCEVRTVAEYDHDPEMTLDDLIDNEIMNWLAALAHTEWHGSRNE